MRAWEMTSRTTVASLYKGMTSQVSVTGDTGVGSPVCVALEVVTSAFLHAMSWCQPSCGKRGRSVLVG